MHMPISGEQLSLRHRTRRGHALRQFQISIAKDHYHTAGGKRVTKIFKHRWEAKEVTSLSKAILE